MTDRKNIRNVQEPGNDSGLSLRLRSVAALVSPGLRMADIGTDHAYVPIWLVQTGRIPVAVAADVNKGPLLRAWEHIREKGLEEQIETRLSDGFLALKPGEVESAVLAGMGGGLMIRILREGEETVRSLKECILQPQSETEKVRAFLLEEGFSFVEESMVLDDGKFYPMMKVRPPVQKKTGSGENVEERESSEQWTEEELRYGRLLLRQKNPVLREFLDREIRIKKQILLRLEGECPERTAKRKKEVEHELYCAEKGLKYYAMQRNNTGD